MTLVLPDIPQHSDYESKEFYLKEALRLSELQIKFQDDTFIAIERKVVLLVTLYIVTIAYMFSWDDATIYVLGENHNLIGIIISLLMSILTFAALIGSLALYPRYFEGGGADPKYLIKDLFKYNFNEMATDLLNEQYEKRLKLNEETLNTKRRYLNISLIWGVNCILVTGLLQIVIKFYYKNPATIDTLISDCQVFLK